MKLSVIVPAYRAAPLIARHVPLLLSHLAGLGVEHETLIVDDGNLDGGETERVARALGCVYVRSPTNRGKGAAVRLGMRHARGELRIFTDADLPYTLDSIDRIVWSLDEQGYDLVTGDRTLPESSYFSEVPLRRMIASRIWSSVIGRLVTGQTFDTQCGLKGFRRAAADDLFGVTRIERFAFDAELFYVALKRGYKILRLPVKLRCQEGTSVQMARDSLRMLGDLALLPYHQWAGHYRARRP